MTEEMKRGTEELTALTKEFVKQFSNTAKNIDWRGSKASKTAFMIVVETDLDKVVKILQGVAQIPEMAAMQLPCYDDGNVGIE